MLLRPYQLDMVQRTRKAYQEHRRVIMVCPTGGGKTRCAAFIARGAQDKGKRTLVLTHRKEIKDQLTRAFQEAGVWCTGQTCIETIGKVASNLGKFSHPEYPVHFIIVDEFHHAVSGQFLSVLEAFPKAHILGLTATPQRLDGRGLNEVADTIVLGPSMKSLIADGWLKKPVYYAPKELVDVSGLRQTAGDYNHQDLEKLMAKPSVTGNAVAEYQRLCAGRTALAFCVTVAHAEAVARAFNEAGITSASIDGTSSSEIRAERLEDISSGQIKVLTSCELISEGYDCPGVGAVISLRPTQSLTLHLQQLGRGLRPSREPDCIILDHAGNCFRHGLAEEDREWSLEGRPRGRASEPAIEVHRCEECYAIFQGGECPQCGSGRKASPREIAAKEGEMRQIFEVAQKINHKAEERACNSLADWQALAQRRGWKPQAAYMRWNCSWKSKVGRKKK